MKIARYFFVGAASAAVDFGLFGVLLLTLGNESWFGAAAVSFVAATAFNYLLSVRLVFSSGVRFTRTNEVLLVFVVSLVGLILNQSAIWFLYKIAGWHIWLSKCMATALAFLWNFTARNNYIFRELK